MTPVPPPTAPPVDAVAPLFELERGRLVQQLESLSRDDWERPTPCPEWTVLGLACHLIGDDFGLLSRRRDGYMGTPAPENQTEEEFIDWLDRLQADWVYAARRMSPRLVTELLAWTGPRLTAVLAAEDPTVRSSRVSWAGPRPVPVWLDQLRELSEYWIHRQQLLQAIGMPDDLDPVLLRPVLSGLRWAYPYRLSQGAFRDSDAVRIQIGAPLDDEWYLALTEGSWDFTPAVQGKVVANAALTAGQAWRLLTNNLSEPVTELDVTGDPRAVSIIATTRAIIGHPK